MTFPPKDRMCHRTSFTKSCGDLVKSEACQKRWVLVQGSDPQTKTPVNEWGCIDDWAHILQLALIDQMRMAAAETEKLRNELLDRISQAKAISERNNRQLTTIEDAHADHY